MQEIMYFDSDNAQLPMDPDDVLCQRPMWQKFIECSNSAWNPLKTLFLKDDAPPTVSSTIWQLWEYEDSIPSSVTEAVEKLSEKPAQEFQQFRKDMSYSLLVWVHISTIDSRRPLAQERGYRRYIPWTTQWFYLQDHKDDMRKWDEQPTLILDAQVRKLREKQPQMGFFSKKVAASVSSRQFSRQNGRSDHTTNSMARSSSPFLRYLSREPCDQY